VPANVRLHGLSFHAEKAASGSVALGEAERFGVHRVSDLVDGARARTVSDPTGGRLANLWLGWAFDENSREFIPSPKLFEIHRNAERAERERFTGRGRAADVPGSDLPPCT
jgi:hypothetical protein